MFDLSDTPVFSLAADSDTLTIPEADYYSAKLSDRPGGHWEGYFWVENERDHLPWPGLPEPPAGDVELPWPF